MEILYSFFPLILAFSEYMNFNEIIRNAGRNIVIIYDQSPKVLKKTRKLFWRSDKKLWFVNIWIVMLQFLKNFVGSSQ